MNFQEKKRKNNKFHCFKLYVLCLEKYDQIKKKVIIAISFFPSHTYLFQLKFMHSSRKLKTKEEEEA